MNRPYYKKIAFTELQLKSRAVELGNDISKDYEGKELVLIALLKGSLYFCADLTRAISVPLMIDFMSIGVYASNQSGIVRITKDLDIDITGKHVLIIEDIVRTGLTLGYLVQNLEARRPASVKVCALFVNPNQQLIDVPLAYTGFTVANEWLMGYGMDAGEKWRNLPYVVEIEKGMS
ncbi:MAG: hypoxanthine phosphoribosyltransferase [Christensenellales bacterium]